MAGKIDRLWIPEKPKVAEAVAIALVSATGAKLTNKATVGRDGFYALSTGDVVCSVFGHLIQMVPPSRYFSKEQNSNPMPHLPLIPNPFLFEPTPERNKDGSVQMKNGKAVPSKRYALLAKLIKQAKTIVNGCDIDREGQLIFDELLIHVGRNPYADDVLRASIVSMKEDAMIEAVQRLDKNNERKWEQRGEAAATRQKMDWLLGMNASMAYQCVTGVRSMSVGRVQTPVLAMVVKRDLEIENFKPQTYYVPVIIMADGTRMRWEKRHGAEGQPGFDANGRITDRSLAQSIVDQIKSGLAGTVTIAKQEEKKESPPLPFSMGSLQSEASKRHGLTVAQVTKAAQNLYEKHKSITYVGTDCRFLPEKMHEDAQGILSSLSTGFKVEAAGANPKIRSKAFNDKKVDEHFAIVPTGKMPQLAANEYAEKLVFDTVVSRYIAQFYPDSRSMQATLAIDFGQDEFRATANEVLELGWKEIEGPRAKGEARRGARGAESDAHRERNSNRG